MDKIIRAMSKDGMIKISAVDGREMVTRAKEIHHTTPTATAALGRLLCAASLLGNMMKEEKASLTMRINGGGPLGGVLAVSDSNGNVRGYVGNPECDLPLRPDGKLDVGGAVGRDGMLTVSRDIGLKEPYIGSTEIVSGEIAEDVAAYMTESEQIPAAVGLGVLVETDLSVAQAGGFIVQIMPDCDEFNLKKFEKTAQNLKSVTAMLDRGISNEELIREVMDGFEVDFLEEKEVGYKCDCCDARMRRAIISLGKKEIEDIIREQGEAEIVCQFCNKAYIYDKKALEDMLSKAK